MTEQFKFSNSVEIAVNFGFNPNNQPDFVANLTGETTLLLSDPVDALVNDPLLGDVGVLDNNADVVKIEVVSSSSTGSTPFVPSITSNSGDNVADFSPSNDDGTIPYDSLYSAGAVIGDVENGTADSFFQLFLEIEDTPEGTIRTKEPLTLEASAPLTSLLEEDLSTIDYTTSETIELYDAGEDGVFWTGDENEVARLVPGEDGNSAVLNLSPTDSNTSSGQTFIGSIDSETLVGNDADNTIYGNGGNDYLDGRGGKDTIVSDNGNDALIGGDGDDLLFGNGGNDYLDGNDGKDRLIGGDNEDILLGGEDNDALNAGDGDDILNGNNGDDTLSGGNGNDGIIGDDGNDVINGGNGNDGLFGGDNDDIIFGEADEDSLFGNDGNDVLVGGAGKDTLLGGSGNDIFVFQYSAENIDLIEDFSADEDLISITADGFGGNLTPDSVLTPDLFVLGTAAVDNNDRFIYDSESGSLFFDLDGIGGIEQVEIAKLSPETELNSDNIFVDSNGVI